jgi:hypothetical protein
MKRALSVAAVCLVALSGCAVDGTDFRPGIAVQVGEDTVSVAEVNELARNYCVALSEQLKAQDQRYPFAAFTGYVASLQAVRLGVEQLAEQYDVTPGPSFRSQEALLRQDVAALPADQAEASIEVESIQIFVTDVLAQVGAIELSAAGQPAVDENAALAAGEKILAEYLDGQEVAVDPRYGFTIAAGQPTTTNDDVSLAVSDLSKLALAAPNGGEPNPDLIAALPDSAICG